MKNIKKDTFIWGDCNKNVNIQTNKMNRGPKTVILFYLLVRNNDSVLFNLLLNRLVGKPTICIGENKDADQLRGNAKLSSAFVFATRIVQFLFYINPKFQASSSFLYLYRSVSVGPVRKPQCWFSHEVAHFVFVWFVFPQLFI